MKNLLFFVILITCFTLTNAQSQVVEIEFCEKLLSKNKILQMNLMHHGDTLPFPKIGCNKFLSPVYFYKLDTTEFTYNQKDTSYKFVTILLETFRYNYEFRVITNFVLPGLTRFCITGRRKKNLYEYNYGRGSLSIAAWAKRKKKIIK